MNTKKEDPIIRFVSKRSNVEVHFDDGRVLSGPRGTTLEIFLSKLHDWENLPILGAVVNRELRELTYPIDMDSHVIPLTMRDADGARIYRRSITFLLEASFDELFSAVKLRVDHSVSSGGYYCEVVGRSPLSEKELFTLENRMNDLAKADIKFERREVPLEQAVDYFKRKGQQDKLRLLKYRNKKHLVLYGLGDHQDYHHGYMVPSTRYLKLFDLIPIGDGFVIRFPRRFRPTELLPVPESATLIKTFRQYGGWLNRLGIQDVGALNDAIREERIQGAILISEALHEQRIAEIASQILERKGQIRIVLIAGPSSSGKTTFSKRLAVQLLAQGGSPYALGLDNYFVDREETPLDENGEYDYEVLGALNTALLNEHLRRLIAEEKVQLPRYNFLSGKSELGEIVKLKKDQLIILEGIHGLNPSLIPEVSKSQTYRIYASCLTQLNLDGHNRISTTDTRLIRRIVRDARERGYTAQQTIQRWDSVRRGEKRHIFPFQENADEMFNSALAYELSALKPLAEPLLRQVVFGTPEYIEAKRLLAFIDWFLPLEMDYVPDNSLLREFIGGSILKHFRLWQNN